MSIETKPTIFLRDSTLETVLSSATSYSSPIVRKKFVISNTSSIFEDTLPSFVDKNGNKVFLRTEVEDEEKVCQVCKKECEKEYRIPISHERTQIKTPKGVYHASVEDTLPIEYISHNIDIFHVGSKIYCSKDHLLTDLRSMVRSDIYNSYQHSERLFGLMCDLMEDVDETKTSTTLLPRFKLFPYTVEQLLM